MFAVVRLITRKVFLGHPEGTLGAPRSTVKLNEFQQVIAVRATREEARQFATQKSQGVADPNGCFASIDGPGNTIWFDAFRTLHDKDELATTFVVVPVEDAFP